LDSEPCHLPSSTTVLGVTSLLVSRRIICKGLVDINDKVRQSIVVVVVIIVIILLRLTRTIFVKIVPWDIGIFP